MRTVELTPRQLAADGIRIAVLTTLVERTAGGGADPHRIVTLAEERREPLRVRAAVLPMTTVDNPLAFQPVDAKISADFIASLAPLNALDASSGAMIPVSANHAATMLTSLAVGTLTDQGKPKPITPLSFANPAPTMAKITAIGVVDDEVLKLGGPNARALLEVGLRGGVALGAGQLLLAVLADDAPTIAASGTDADAFLHDLTLARRAIHVTAGSALYAATSAAQLADLALLPDPSGKLRDLTYKGGSVGGIIFVVDDSIEHDSAGSTITLYDASKVLLADEGMAFRASREALLQMDDAPTDPPTAATVMVSTWQTNRTAALAERYVGIGKSKPDCASVIEGANYGA